MSFSKNLHKTMRLAADAVALEREVAIRDAMIMLILTAFNNGDPVGFRRETLAELADESQTEGPLCIVEADEDGNVILRLAE